jgi:hypothetical protein
MAVIINELEVVLEAPDAAPQPAEQSAVPEQPQISPHDILTLMDRERRMFLRTLAH